MFVWKQKLVSSLKTSLHFKSCLTKLYSYHRTVVSKVWVTTHKWSRRVKKWEAPRRSKPGFYIFKVPFFLVSSSFNIFHNRLNYSIIHNSSGNFKSCVATQNCGYSSKAKISWLRYYFSIKFLSLLFYCASFNLFLCFG